MKSNIVKRQIGDLVYTLNRNRAIYSTIDEIYITITKSGVTEEYLLVNGFTVESSNVFNTQKELLDSIAKQLEE